MRRVPKRFNPDLSRSSELSSKMADLSDLTMYSQPLWSYSFQTSYHSLQGTKHVSEAVLVPVNEPIH